MKHLKVLEDNNLVISFEEKSTIGGPPRKCYVSNKHISLRIDVGPNTFNSEIYDYKEIEEKDNKDDELKNKMEKFDDLEKEFQKSHKIENPNEKLSEFSKIIQDIDKELEDIKLQRVKLLNIREKIIHESNRLIAELSNEYNERKILYYLISHGERDLSTIAEALELREKVIMELFRQLMKQRLWLDFDDELEEFLRISE